MRFHGLLEQPCAAGVENEHGLSVSQVEDRRILAFGAESGYVLTLTEHPIFTPEKESFRAP
jgi:hypothetical protein